MSSLLTMSRPEEANELAGALLHVCGARRVFAFQGEMGAGKTTLIKALCAELGVEHGTGSPSYSIVNEYKGAHNERVYHFDLFRLKDRAELDGIGFVEYLDSGNYCFVEWPELASNLLPQNAVRIRVNVVGDQRSISLEV